jgi:hypothetical protein
MHAATVGIGPIPAWVREPERSTIREATADFHGTTFRLQFSGRELLELTFQEGDKERIVSRNSLAWEIIAHDVSLGAYEEEPEE